MLINEAEEWQGSVQFSRSVVSDSLRPHEPQHARPPCPSKTPRVHQNPCPLSRWCHPAISSSVVPFSSCPQSLPASGSFHMSQLFASGGQSIGVSASASVLPMNIQDWSPLGWTGWISAVQGTLKSLLQHHSSKASILRCSAFFIVQLSYLYMTTGETIVLTRRTFVDKVMSLLFNMLSRLVITFLPRSKHLLIGWKALFERAKPFDFHPEGNREQHSEYWCWSLITSFCVQHSPGTAGNSNKVKDLFCGPWRNFKLVRDRRIKIISEQFSVLTNY